MRQSIRSSASLSSRSLSGSRQRCVRVVLLDRSEIFVNTESKTKIADVFREACHHLSLREVEYFGLALLLEDEYQFLDPDVKIHKLFPKSWRASSSSSSSSSASDCATRPQLSVYFRVQYYVNQVALLRQRTTRSQYYLQLKENALQQDQLRCEENCYNLAALSLQSEYGAWSVDLGATYFRVGEHLPQWVVRKRGEAYLSTHVPTMHRSLGNMSRPDATLAFIREASAPPASHNVHLHWLSHTKNCDSSPKAWLGVCPHGLHIYSEMYDLKSPLTELEWGQIAQLHFEKKRFEISVVGAKQGRACTYFTGKDSRSKYLLALCRGAHEFSMRMAPQLSELRRLKAHERDGVGVGSGYREKLVVVEPQRDSLISSASSNTTTSGIVSDRMHSFDSEDEIMIDSPPRLCSRSGTPCTSSGVESPQLRSSAGSRTSIHPLPLSCARRGSSNRMTAITAPTRTPDNGRHTKAKGNDDHEAAFMTALALDGSSWSSAKLEKQFRTDENVSTGAIPKASGRRLGVVGAPVAAEMSLQTLTLAQPMIASSEPLNCKKISPPPQPPPYQVASNAVQNARVSPRRLTQPMALRPMLHRPQLGVVVVPASTTTVVPSPTTLCTSSETVCVTAAATSVSAAASATPFPPISLHSSAVGLTSAVVETSSQSALLSHRNPKLQQAIAGINSPFSGAVPTSTNRENKPASLSPGLLPPFPAALPESEALLRKSPASAEHSHSLTRSQLATRSTTFATTSTPTTSDSGLLPSFNAADVLAGAHSNPASSPPPPPAPPAYKPPSPQAYVNGIFQFSGVFPEASVITTALETSFPTKTSCVVAPPTYVQAKAELAAIQRATSLGNVSTAAADPLVDGSASAETRRRRNERSKTCPVHCDEVKTELMKLKNKKSSLPMLTGLCNDTQLLNSLSRPGCSCDRDSRCDEHGGGGGTTIGRQSAAAPNRPKSWHSATGDLPLEVKRQQRYEENSSELKQRHLWHQIPLHSPHSNVSTLQHCSSNSPSQFASVNSVLYQKPNLGIA